MSDLGARIQGFFGELGAVSRAAATFLLGIADPHDEDIIDIVECKHPPTVPCRHTPVFLVHGFTHNWSGWLPLMEVLGANGFHRFVRFNYESIGDPPEEIAGALARRIFEVKERLEIDKVSAVGHSLGGVVLRYWSVALGGEDSINRVVTIASPLQGTPLIRVPIGPRGVAELVPGGEFVRILNTEGDDRTRWTTLAGDQDLLVPARYADLPGSTHQVFTGLGHVGLLYDPDVLAAVAQALIT